MNYNKYTKETIQKNLYKRDKKQAKSGVERSFEAVLLSLVNLTDVMQSASRLHSVPSFACFLTSFFILVIKHHLCFCIMTCSTVFYPSFISATKILFYFYLPYNTFVSFLSDFVLYPLYQLTCGNSLYHYIFLASTTDFPCFQLFFIF